MTSAEPQLDRLAVLRTAVSPAFYVFVIKRLLTALYLEMTAFAASRTVGPSGGVGRGVIIRRNTGLRMGVGTILRAGAELSGTVAPDGEPTLTLGRFVRIGRRVQLGAGADERLRIGDYTSIHNGCIILGDVTVGRHCLLSNNIFISSSDHFSDVRPSWLIKDQDALVATAPELAARRSMPVVIEDDCWIGWGAVIRRGVHIGRGAIVGANSVVTHDVPPYAIHVGAPNRPVGSRLDFDPPERISCDDPAHLPYFYSGFDLRAARNTDKRSGVPCVDRTARIVLRGGRWKTLRLTGRANGATLSLRVNVNGSDAGSLSLTREPAESTLGLPLGSSAADRLPPTLGAYTVIVLQVQSTGDVVDAEYSLQMVAVEA